MQMCIEYKYSIDKQPSSYRRQLVLCGELDNDFAKFEREKDRQRASETPAGI